MIPFHAFTQTWFDKENVGNWKFNHILAGCFAKEDLKWEDILDEREQVIACLWNVKLFFVNWRIQGITTLVRWRKESTFWKSGDTFFFRNTVNDTEEENILYLVSQKVQVSCLRKLWFDHVLVFPQPQSANNLHNFPHSCHRQAAGIALRSGFKL